jgi:hypothetical protein
MRLFSLCLATVLVPALLVGAAEAQKTNVEFDKSADFAAYKTFAWDPTPPTTARPLLVEAIKGAVADALSKSGMKQVADSPDLYVQIYGGLDSDAAISYSDLFYGPAGIAPFDQSFLIWGAVPGAATTVIVHKGQLVIDLLDAHQKKLVWRGKANAKLSDKRQKALEQVNAAVDKLFAQYPPKQ